MPVGIKKSEWKKKIWRDPIFWVALLSAENTRYGGLAELGGSISSLHYVVSSPNPVKLCEYSAGVLEMKIYINNTRLASFLQNCGKTHNIILRPWLHPTGFTPGGGFHPDSVNEHARTKKLAVRAALSRSGILYYSLYVFSLSIVLSFIQKP